LNQESRKSVTKLLETVNQRNKLVVGHYFYLLMTVITQEICIREKLYNINFKLESQFLQPKMNKNRRV